MGTWREITLQHDITRKICLRFLLEEEWNFRNMFSFVRKNQG